MSWFKLDDGFYDHPKIVNAGNTAAGLYARCGAWCAKQLTNGFIPNEIGRSYGSQTSIKKLEAQGLWERVKGGWLMHDYLDYNPSRDQVQAERETTAQRQRAWREKRKGNGVSNGVTSGARNGVTNTVTTASVTPLVTANVTRESHCPDPTRPVTTPAGHVGQGGSGGESAASLSRRDSPPKNDHGTRLPDDFAVTPAMAEWARQNTPHVDGRHEFEQFRDYWTAKSGRDATKRDWLATWRRWMRESEQRAGRPAGHRAVPTSERNLLQTQQLKQRMADTPNQLQLPRGST